MARGHHHLTRRERQIMDVLYRRESATAADVQAELPDPPSYSAVRALLRKLEEKGHVRHEWDGPRYVYRPTLPRESARDGALDRLIATFFGGSAVGTIAALLDRASSELGEEDLAELERLIEEARRRGRS
jgi:BlaI family transcriptional regulator, penicillinase repressor